MPNGKEMMKDLEFEDMIKGWSQPEQFLARNLLAVKRECESRKICPASFQLSRKQIVTGVGGTGGVALLVSIIVQVISKLLTK